MKNSEKHIEIAVTTLGGFSISCNGVELSAEKNRNKQLFSLLQFLIIKRNTVISSDKLYTLLWQEDNIENPAGALKNLVYRLRKMLSPLEPYPGFDFIVSRQGVYSFASDCICRVDIEEIDSLNAAIPKCGTRAESAEIWLKIADAYKGEFLPASSYDDWVIPISEYYKTLFIGCVNNLSDYYQEVGRHEDIDRICSKAIEREPFNEQMHLGKMRALVAMSRNSDALKHYEYVTGMFYKELGIHPSNEFREIYVNALKSLKGVETDLLTIKTDLCETRYAGGAFVCDYAIFNYIYQLESRKLERNGNSVFITLISLRNTHDGVISEKYRERLMELLEPALVKSLRRGDLLARYSTSQYVAMLQGMSAEDADIITSRMKRNFYQNYSGREAILNIQMMPIEPDAV